MALSGDTPIGLVSAYAFPDVEAGGTIAYLYDVEVVASHRNDPRGVTRQVQGQSGRLDVDRGHI